MGFKEGEKHKENDNSMQEDIDVSNRHVIRIDDGIQHAHRPRRAQSLVSSQKSSRTGSRWRRGRRDSTDSRRGRMEDMEKECGRKTDDTVQ